MDAAYDDNVDIRGETEESCAPKKCQEHCTVKTKRLKSGKKTPQEIKNALIDLQD